MLMRNVLTAAKRQVRYGLEYATRTDPVQARSINAAVK